jgi:hypothetical protein
MMLIDVLGIPVLLSLAVVATIVTTSIVLPLRMAARRSLSIGETGAASE